MWKDITLNNMICIKTKIVNKLKNHKHNNIIKNSNLQNN